MVQLPEATDEKSEATKLDTRTSAKSARNVFAELERRFKKKDLKQSHFQNTSGIKPAFMWNTKKNVIDWGIFQMNTS